MIKELSKTKTPNKRSWKAREKKSTTRRRVKSSPLSRWAVVNNSIRNGENMRSVMEPLEQVERRVEQSSTTGIVLLTSTRQSLYMNRQAQELCHYLVEIESGMPTKGPLPRAVADLQDEVMKHLERSSHIKDWESVELSRVAGDAERPMLLRGLGFPDPIGLSPACILIVMEESSNRPETAPIQARDKFRLTAREQAALQYLVKGCTNKEIADALGISEPTVKEHVRNIMQKTGTHTRTGILARILGS